MEFGIGKCEKGKKREKRKKKNYWIRKPFEEKKITSSWEIVEVHTKNKQRWKNFFF